MFGLLCDWTRLSAELLQDKIKDNQHDLSTMIPALAAMAAELVRDLDPQVGCNELLWLALYSQP